MSKLTSKAVLVQLQISQWTGRKYDKAVSDEVTASKNAVAAAGRYNKSLLPMTDALKQVHQKSTLIRTEYYKNTLPWGVDGAQLLPTANYIDFTRVFSKHKNEWYSLVGDFLSQYDQLKEDAKLGLGDLYNEADYPTMQDLSNKFKMELAVFPVPSDDFRVDLPDAELEAIQHDVERQVQEASNRAMREVWQRLYDRVEHMAQKLSDPAAIFRDSLVETARELCDLLPRLNVEDDPNLRNMTQAVQFRLARFDADDLRRDLDLRKQVATDATRIMDKMRGFMG